ncbi:MAG: hypothetical protein KGZ63_00180 [Clostridiales bacterium]|jgi:hypoxanthine phosphoribosyltransferase|nr:hypothetical protein [Clostridiales bacterium]
MTQRLELVLSRETIEKRIVELGKEISADYAGKDPVLVCVLRGSVYFTVDLTRQLTVPYLLDFIAISGYTPDENSLGIVRITKDLDTSVAGREVIIFKLF